MLAGGSNGPEDIRAALSQAAKDGQNLWEENRDLQRIQMAIGQLESETKIRSVGNRLANRCKNAASCLTTYEMLIDRRAQLTTRLNNGLQFVAMLQNSLISERLFNWKNQQKLAQVGFPFENRDQCLDEIQKEFEFLAEQNWQLRTFACYQHDFVKRGPQLNDNNAQTCAQNISAIMDQLSKLLCMLVSQSFVVTVQPDPVLKTQHKFGTEVQDAKLLSSGQLSEKDIKTVGSISNDFEKMMMDEKGHMAAKFNNSETHTHRPSKANSKNLMCVDNVPTLNGHCSWVTRLRCTRGNLWQRASAPSGCDIQHVAWQELGEVIRYKFSLFTGARRPLSDSDLNYLYEKFFVSTRKTSNQ
ncbi:unnamed protein product, partial [Mesorhabditis belari]|uniref:STAT transcription factor all-alpha domain-containing protein n=1 Tax=Mesorhabditis belari TaxID=2138241 RepID=A0AAF3FSA5_9BILA